MPTPQSLSNGDIGQRLHLIGGGSAATNLISGTYQTGVQPGDSPLLSTQFLAGRGQALMISIAATFANGSTVTDMRFKLQGVPRQEWAPTGIIGNAGGNLFASSFPLSGSVGGSGWIDILTLDHLGKDGTVNGGATGAEHVYVKSAGNTLFDVLMTADAYMFFALQVVAECTGGATAAGDIAQAWVNIG